MEPLIQGMAHLRKSSRYAQERGDEEITYGRISKELDAMRVSPPPHCSAGEMNDQMYIQVQKENQNSNNMLQILLAVDS